MQITNDSPLEEVVAEHLRLGLGDSLEFLWYLKGCDCDTAAEAEAVKRDLLAEIRAHQRRRNHMPRLATKRSKAA